MQTQPFISRSTPASTDRYIILGPIQAVGRNWTVYDTVDKKAKVECDESLATEIRELLNLRVHFQTNPGGDNNGIRY